MIGSKYLNRVVAVILGLAVLFTLCFTYSPGALGISAGAAEPEYATALFGGGVVSIDITADEDEWSDMLENATAEEYIPCDVTINGTAFGTVGIRPKGNSSLSTVAASDDTDRYSFKLEFDHYVKGQTAFGLDKLALNNIQSDATYMKEYLSYDLLTYIGVPTPLYQYASITVNGEPWGFYLAVEAVEESFAERSFGADYGMLYKPENMGARGAGQMNAFIDNNFNSDGQGTTDGAQSASGDAKTADRGGNGRGGGGMSMGGNGTSLVYTDDEISSYSSIFDNAVFDASDADYERVIEALEHLDEGTDLEQYIDVDEVLRYIAANAVLVNLDSYFGTMQHNYYLYEENGKLSMLPWDYNLSFGGFMSGDASSVVNFPIDTPVSGAELSQRPMIAKLLAVDEYREKYHQYLQEIVQGYFESGRFSTTIDTLDAEISGYVKNDASAFVTYDEYAAALPMLKLYGDLRSQSIAGQLSGEIPSTSDGQSADSSALIDASGLSLSLMGSQGGMGGGGNRFGNAGGFRQPGMAGGSSERAGKDTPSASAVPSAAEEVPQGSAALPDGFAAQSGDSSDTQSGTDAAPGFAGGGFDTETMRQAMEILQEAGDGDLTQEQLDSLYALGLTDEQIERFRSMAGGFAGGMGENGAGGGPDFADRGNVPSAGAQSVPSAQAGDHSSLILLVVCAVLLAAGILFAAFYRRRKFHT